MAIRYPGFRFLPTDDELFFYYLMRKLHQEPLPDLDIIRDCDLYGGGDPWEIFGKDRDEKFYVFTKLKKKNKSRVDRTAGSGTWKGEQSYKIRNSQGDVVGYKKLFAFKPKASSSAEANNVENGHWIMYEYSKHPRNETERVLCVISNKYAEEASKKACRNFHDQAQLEAPRDDHTNAVDVLSTASPPSTAATAQAQISIFPTYNEDKVAIPRDICGPASLDFAGKADLNSHPAATTKTVPKGIHCTTDPPAFGGANGGPVSTTSTAAPMVDREWADQLKNMEISPAVKHLFYKVVQQRARALDARNNVFVLPP